MKNLFTFLMISMVSFSTMVYAHDKKLSEKTLCHKQKDFYTHWHVDDDPKKAVGGKCELVDGVLTKVLPEVKMISLPNDDYISLITEKSKLETDLTNANAEIVDLKDEIYDLRIQVNIANTSARQANDEAEAARLEASNAKMDAAAADLRAVGKGPSVSPKCVRGVHAALNAGWRFSGDEKDALRKACLE